MEAIIQALLVWIASNSHYSIENITPPVVKFVTPSQITAEYYIDNQDLMPEGGIDDRIWALYDANYENKGAIYIRLDSNGWSTNSLEDDPILTERLLHELVHHVQFKSGEVRTYQCPAQGEKLAYQLGGRFFKQRHMDDPMPNRHFWAHVYSRC